MVTITAVGDATMVLGEGPVWNAQDGRLYMIDCVGSRMAAYAPETGLTEVWSLPEYPGSYAFMPDGGVLMALLDEAAAAAGVWSAGNVARRSVTVDLTTSFVGRAGAGRLTATGTMIGHGRQIFFCRSEVRDAAGALVAAASSTHRWRTERAPPV